jgi:hypothetical protein
LLVLGWQATYLLTSFRIGREPCGPAIIGMWQGDSSSLQVSGSAAGPARADLAGILETTGCGTAATGRVADHGGLAGLAVLVLAVLDLTSERHRVAGAEAVGGRRFRGHTVGADSAVVDFYPVHEREAGLRIEEPSGPTVVLDHGDTR